MVAYFCGKQSNIQVVRDNQLSAFIMRISCNTVGDRCLGKMMILRISCNTVGEIFREAVG